MKSVNNLLPVRFRPAPDELFSSWLSRLAIGNVSKLHTFSSIIFSKRPIWDRDIDKFADNAHITEIAAYTGIEEDLIFSTTLRAYEGKIYELHNPNGNSPWLMPIGVFKRIRSRFGLQMCPQCLREDAEEPYFRKFWRISWATICTKHEIMLLDKCPDCCSPIMFHRGDMGLRSQNVSVSMSRCSICDVSWTSERIINLTTKVDRQSVDTQLELEKSLSSGWYEIPNFGTVSSIPFFNGLKHLLRLLSVSRKGRKFREEISLQSGIEFISQTEDFHHFDHLPVELRLNALKKAQWLLNDWYKRFVDIARESQSFKSSICHDKEEFPFWLWLPIHDHLSKSQYRVTEEEIGSALEWLKKEKTLILPSDLEALIGRNLFEHKSNKFKIQIYSRMANHNLLCEKNRISEIRRKAYEIRTKSDALSKTKAITVSRAFLKEKLKSPNNFLKTAKMYESLIDKYKCKERLKMSQRMEITQNASVVAAEFSISPSIVRKWYLRYKKDGLKGLSDYSRKPFNFPHKIVFHQQDNWIRALHAENFGLTEIKKELLNRYNFTITEGGLYGALKRLNLTLPCSKKNRKVKTNRKVVMNNRQLPQKKIYEKQEKWILNLHFQGFNNSQIKRELLIRYNFSIGLSCVRETIIKKRIK